MKEIINKLVVQNSDDVAKLVTNQLVMPNMPGAKDAKHAHGRVHKTLTQGGRSAAYAEEKNVQNGQKQVQDLPPPEVMFSADWFDKWLGRANIGVMGAQFGLPIVAGGMGAIGAHGISSNLKKVEATTFSELGQMTGMSGVARGVSEASMSVAGAGASVLEKLGITGLMSRYYSGQFDKHIGRMADAAQDVFSHRVADAKLGASLDAVRGHLAVAHPTHINYDGLTEAITAAKTQANEVGHSVLAKSLGGLEKSALKAHNAHYFADGTANLAHYASNATGKMAKAPVVHGLMNATFIAGAAIDDYRTGSDLHTALKDLKAMHCAITGEKPDDVSTWGLMLGKVSEPVAAARSEILKEFGPASVLSAANTMLNLKFATNSKYGSMGKSIALLVAVPMANAILVRGMLGGRMLPAYKELKQAEHDGQELSNEQYAKLIGNASKELHARGGPDGNFAKALGVFYAHHHARVDTVLKEVSNGTLHKRIEQLQHEFEVFKREHPEIVAAHQQQAQAAQVPHHEEKQGVSHVDRLKNGGHAPRREVVGTHTEKLANRAGSPAEGQQPTL